MSAPSHPITSTAAVLHALGQAVHAAEAIPGKAFAISVTDAGGHVLGSIRQDGAAISAAHSAESKARTAIYLLADTGALPPTSPLIPAMTGGLPYPVNMFAGGLLIRSGDAVIGAVGVGGSPDPADDLIVARAALTALG